MITRYIHACMNACMHAYMHIVYYVYLQGLSESLSAHSVSSYVRALARAHLPPASAVPLSAHETFDCGNRSVHAALDVFVPPPWLLRVVHSVDGLLRAFERCALQGAVVDLGDLGRVCWPMPAMWCYLSSANQFQQL